MATTRVLVGFSSLSLTDLVSKTETIIASMTGNANFATPVPALADVQAKEEALSTVAVAVKMGDKSQITLRNQLQSELIVMLKNLGDYVNFTAKGDAVVAASSGFGLPKDPSPLPDIAKPEGLYVEDGPNAGEFNVGIKSVKGAKSYIYQYTSDAPDSNAKWVSENSTYVKNTISGLDKGKTYWCRVAAVGTRTQVVFSDALSRVSQ